MILYLNSQQCSVCHTYDKSFAIYTKYHGDFEYTICREKFKIKRQNDKKKMFSLNKIFSGSFLLWQLAVIYFLYLAAVDARALPVVRLGICL